MRQTEDTKVSVPYGLPREVRFCAKCVISNQRPSSVVEFKHTNSDKKPTIGFDNDGVCSACNYAAIKDNIDWEERENELKALCARFRSKNGYYDCIVPGSGGKDSTFTAHMLKYKYGMNPLTVTWAPHIYTGVGFRNLHHWIDGGFDNILFTPNGQVHRLLTRYAFLNLLHPFQPFIIGQRNIAPRYSILFNIPLVFYGENQAEYGNAIEENMRPTMDMDFFATDIDLSQINLGGVSAEMLVRDKEVSLNDLNPYLPVAIEQLNTTKTEVHYLGYYLKWDPQECYYYAAENCGFEANTQRTEGSYSKYSSIDDKIDPFHYYTTLIKFGIGRATYDASQEIRNRKITREEGVALVRKFDTEFPVRYFKEVLEYMDLTREVFWETIEKFRSPHLWEQTNGEWKLKYQVE